MRYQSPKKPRIDDDRIKDILVQLALGTPWRAMKDNSGVKYTSHSINKVKKWFNAIPLEEAQAYCGNDDYILRKVREDYFIRQPSKQYDQLALKSKKEHYDKLADIARDVLSDNLHTVIPTRADVVEYEYVIKNGGVDSPVYPITKEQLSNALTRNMEMICDVEGDWLFHECFVAHLGAEVPDVQTKGIWKVAEEQPYELIRILRILAERKVFKGTCPGCP